MNLFQTTFEEKKRLRYVLWQLLPHGVETGEIGKIRVVLRVSQLKLRLKTYLGWLRLSPGHGGGLLPGPLTNPVGETEVTYALGWLRWRAPSVATPTSRRGWLGPVPEPWWSASDAFTQALFLEYSPTFPTRELADSWDLGKNPWVFVEILEFFLKILEFFSKTLEFFNQDGHFSWNLEFYPSVLSFSAILWF